LFAGISDSFQDVVSKISDRRGGKNKRYSVEEILFLALTAMICGCEGWRDIERFGGIKLPFLRQFFPYNNGVPSDDTLRRFFRYLNPAEFKGVFSEWAEALDFQGVRQIAIDEKVSKRAFDGEEKPLHLVSAFAEESRLVLG
jgi:hypothetical protein